jgi:hypothetical protein
MRMSVEQEAYALCDAGASLACRWHVPCAFDATSACRSRSAEYRHTYECHAIIAISLENV